MKKNQGFTLLEILLVLVILAFASSAVVMYASNDDTSLINRQTNQLAEDFNFARNLATSKHRLVGWQVTSQGYRFVQRDVLGRWQPIDSRALQPKNWPENLQLLGLREELPSSYQHQQAPLVVFFPAGEVTSLKFGLQLNEASKQLHLTHNRLEEVAD